MNGPNRILANLIFGKNGNAEACQSGAWSDAEDGHTWALSPGCALTVTISESAGDAVLLFEIWPATAPPDRPARTMRLQRERHLLAQLSLENRGVFCIPMGSVCAGSNVHLTFLFDAPLPRDGGDTRPLAFGFRSLRVIGRDEPRSIRQITKPPLFALDMDEPNARRISETFLGEPLAVALLHFESLGQACDFGFLQRRCEAEPLGLLRFGGIPTHGLVEGLIDGFARLGEPGSLQPIIIEERKREYLLLDRLYGLSWHTALDPAQVEPGHAVAREARRLPFLKRLFFETLAAGEKIFILRPPRSMEFAEADAVATALRLHSNCKLLWAVQEQGIPGSLDLLRPYFFRGHLDVDGKRGSASAQAWLNVCCNMLLEQYHHERRQPGDKIAL
jgi:hypothetical protein